MMEDKYINNIHKKNSDNFNNNEKIEKFLNNISYIVQNFLISINQFINNLQNNTSKLNKHIISSNTLLKEIKIDKKYTIKLQQLNGRIGMLEDTRKLIKENIKLINYNLSYFSNDIKKSLRIMNEYILNIHNNSKSLNINNNNNINIEKVNNNYEYKHQLEMNSMNSCDDIENLPHKIGKIKLTGNINLINNGFNTINNVTPLNRKRYNNFDSKKKYKGIKDIILNSGLKQMSTSYIKSNQFFSTGKKLKSNFNLDKDINSSNISKSISYRLIKDKYKDNINEEDDCYDKDISFNPQKNSRNYQKNFIMKKSSSLSNFLLDRSSNFKMDKKNNNNNYIFFDNYNKSNSKTNFYLFPHNNFINNKTIVPNNNDIYSSTINSNNNISNNDSKNNTNDFSIYLSRKVIIFLSIIKEMKTKYNNRHCANNSEFKQTKLKYEQLKQLLDDLSHKIINNVNININNANTINNMSNINNINTINDMNELLNNIQKYKDTIFELESKLNNLKKELYLKEKENKTLIRLKEKLLNDNTQKNNIITIKLKEIEELKMKNNIKDSLDKNSSINSELINNLKSEIEQYIIKNNKLQQELKSKIIEIKKRDKIIDNLKNDINKQKNIIKHNTSNSNNFNKNKINSNKDNKYKNLLKENIINILYIKGGNPNNNKDINHQNNNIYIINELKEKLKNITEDNSNYKNKYNDLLNSNTSLNDEINALSQKNKEYEAIRDEQEKEIKKLKQTINDLNSKINKDSEGTKKIYDFKEKEEQLELILIENQELKNQIEELRENINNSSIKENENNYKKIIDDYKSKIDFISEQNNYYQNEIKNLKTENSIVQNEFKSVKNENNLLNRKIKEYNIKNENDEYIPDNYDIICEKNVGNLSWVLLRKKNGNEDNYEDYIWVEKAIIDNIDEFNYINEIDLVNKQIINYISKLEEKDNTISKLTQKLKNYEK